MVFAGANSLSAAIASAYLSAWLTKPTFGSGLNTFSSPAVTVQTTNHVAGTNVTPPTRLRLFLNKTTVQTVRAIAASIWFAVPNRGHRVQMPPSGSITPAYRKSPQSAHESAKPTRLLGQEPLFL